MRVLLVDNNLSNRLVAKAILEREGYSVSIVSNGAEAILMLQSTYYDIVVLDIVMPIMDGFQTVQYLMRSKIEPLHTFALTAYDSEDDIHLYKAAGFDGIIAKPLRSGDLSAAMRREQGQAPTLIGVAANGQDSDTRPLLDEAIIFNGPGKADDVTRERIWRGYRTDLSDSLKDISRALPGYLEQDEASTIIFLNALHSLRSASLTVGMNRAPYLAKQLRNIPTDQIVEGVADLLHTVRDSLPALEQALLSVSKPSIATR